MVTRQRVIRQYKIKKGDRRLPRINYFCIANMYKHLTREQRYAIYLGKQKGETLEIIARSIGVHRSTVSREIRRDSTLGGKYGWNKKPTTWLRPVNVIRPVTGGWQMC